MTSTRKFVLVSPLHLGIPLYLLTVREVEDPSYFSNRAFNVSPGSLRPNGNGRVHAGSLIVPVTTPLILSSRKQVYASF